MNSVFLSSVPTPIVILFIVVTIVSLVFAYAPRLLRLLAPSFLAALLLLQTHVGNAQTPTPAETQTTSGASAPLRELPDLSSAAPPIPGDYVRSDQGWVTFGYTTYAAPRMEPVFKAANEAREKIELEFGQSVLAKVEVRVARNPEEMKKLAPYGRPPPSYASGVA